MDDSTKLHREILERFEDSLRRTFKTDYGNTLSDEDLEKKVGAALDCICIEPPEYLAGVEVSIDETLKALLAWEPDVFRKILGRMMSQVCEELSSKGDEYRERGEGVESRIKIPLTVNGSNKLCGIVAQSFPETEGHMKIAFRVEWSDLKTRPDVTRQTRKGD